ncbi:hypothetical protein B0T16DRAFT_80895 [Cercophora newfieldiana]|uniref:Uncharacterized protein n=1 Tax=Cercophora newfieldiana TaxID=92897 RepID=A0AA39YH91_9PEZI|nr:hypothetical protein B0T16DRAFT_80895 [Cercophora newfieldiana]
MPRLTIYSEKARSRRLLKKLKELQEKDEDVPPKNTFTIKYLLRQFSSCRVALIVIDPIKDYGFTGFTFDPNRVPKFLASQLGAQMLTASFSDFAILSAVLRHLSLTLALDFSGPKIYPTLFRWYSKQHHRHYNLFGFLRDEMPERQKTYTITELLSLQDHRIPGAVKAMAANPEIADIVRTSGVPVKLDESKLTAKKSNSSTSSDEVLYKGNMTRRNNMRATTRDSAAESCRGPLRGSGRESIRGNSRDPIRSSAPEALPEPSQQQPQREPAPREVSREGASSDQWQYRGRSESEVASGEPASAPTGIPAQQKAGFQRFVQAVVSPTHVRVTAGGKIVPNTRGHPSPTSKRLTDSATTDGNGMPEMATHAKPSVAPIPTPQVAMPPAPAPMLPPYFPGFPPGFQPQFPYVGLYPQMAPNYAFGQNSMGAPAMAQQAAANTLKDMHNTKPGEARNENGSSADKQEKVKITPPEYFDYTKPFVYNGQYVFPMAHAPVPFPPGMGGPVMPVQMLSVPPVMPPIVAPGMPPQQPGQFLHPTGQVLQPPRPTSVGSVQSMNAAPFHAPSQTPGGSTIPTHNGMVNASTQPITAAPITSIKPSEITKKQLNNFKVALRYNEDQLQFNRHQIDEKDMEQKIQTLQAHIREFESKLKMQLDHEAKVLGLADQKKAEEPMPAAEAAKTSPSSVATVNHIAVPNTAGVPAPYMTSSGNFKAPAFGWPLDKDGKPQPHFSDEDFSQQLFKGQKGWPSDAVFAPAFTPGIAINPPFEMPTQGQRGESRNQPMMAGMGMQSRWPPEKATETTGSVRSAQPSRSNNSSRGDTKFGVPYLLGTLPKGKDLRTASDEDYVYSRPLTAEERRSRFLYWGDCPKEVLKGLPKFDGRHFYPPSPVKERSASPSQASPPLRVPTSRQEADCAVRETKSEHDPFRPLTPVQKFGSSKQLMVSEDGWRTARQVSDMERGPLCCSESSEATFDLGPSQGLANTASGSREGIADAAAPNSQERRPGGSNGARLWPAMLKKAPTSSAVSSTTAQGYLPQFSGHAAASLSPASLSPSMNKNLISPIREVSPGKVSADFNERTDGGVLLTPAPEIRRENFPLNNVSSLEDQFKNISIGSSDRHTMPGPYKL